MNSSAKRCRKSHSMSIITKLMQEVAWYVEWLTSYVGFWRNQCWICGFYIGLELIFNILTFIIVLNNTIFGIGVICLLVKSVWYNNVHAFWVDQSFLFSFSGWHIYVSLKFKIEIYSDNCLLTCLF